MATVDVQEKAKQYLRDQAKIIGKYGTTPKLHGDVYEEAVSSTERTFEILLTRSGKTQRK